MTYRGHVSKGTIVLDEPVSLPEGASVAICVCDSTQSETVKEDSAPTLYERLFPIIGVVDGLPPDASRK